MKKNRIVLFILIMHSCLNYSQNQIVPVSPEAAALAKIVNYPINYNTGVPNINIPFYEVTVGDLKLPITLDYHAGGFKINEQSTRVGLGWSLSCDLQITRSINGLDDFAAQGYINNPLITGNYSQFLWNGLEPYHSSGNPYGPDGEDSYALAIGEVDGMPDTFYYKLLNKSGSFYYQKNNGTAGGRFIPVPYDNIKITCDNKYEFTIVDTDGTTYTFGMPGSCSKEQVADYKREYTADSSLNLKLTGWKCSTIESNNLLNNITFTYANKTPVTHITYNDKIEFFKSIDSNQCFDNIHYGPIEYPLYTYSNYTTYEQLKQLVPFYKISSPKYINYFYNKAEFHVPYLDANNVVLDKSYSGNSPLSNTTVHGGSLSKIEFRGGKVEFSGADNLDLITILDDKGVEVKSLRLYQTNVGSVYNYNANTNIPPVFTRYLDSLHVKNGASTFQRYAMLYNLDSYNRKFVYGNSLKGHDAWGYPNINTRDILKIYPNVPDYLTIPQKTININQFYKSCITSEKDIKIAIGSDNYWSEEVDENVAKQGILKRIIYPTGGALDFDFENNKYRDTIAGSKFQNLPRLAGGLRIRSINFLDENSKLVKQKYYRYGDFEEGTGTVMFSPSRVTSVTDLNGQTKNQHSFDAQSYVQNIYYLNGTYFYGYRNLPNLLATEQKTTYQPISALDFTYASGSPIYYTKVTEYEQDLGKETGKTVHSYYEPNKFSDYHYDLHTYSSIVPETNIPYIKTGWMMGAQKSVAIYKYDLKDGYKPIHKKSFKYERANLVPLKVAYCFLNNIILGGDNNEREIYVNDDFANTFNFGQYSIPLGKLLLTQENNEWYETSGVKKDSIFYKYGSWPDANDPHLQPTYMHPSEVQTTDSFGNTISTKTNYAYDFSGVSPYNLMAVKNMIEQPIEEIKTKTYKNTTTTIELSRKKTNYGFIPDGWGFYAPTSIESSVKGAPLVTDMTFDKYDEFGNVLQTTAKNGVPTSYLWGYNHKYPVAKLENVYYSTIPNSFISNSIIGDPASDPALLGTLADLRSVFNNQGKFISTYTYKRQVGVTSSTLPNAVSQYYEYDPIGRLTTQRDANLNILKTNEYQVNNTTKNCFPANLQYYSVPMMRSMGFDCTGLGFLINNIKKGGDSVFDGYESDLENFTEPVTDSSGIISAYINRTDCIPTNCGSSITNAATIDMTYSYYGLYSDGYPVKMKIDFIQNESIVATQNLIPYNHIDPYSNPSITSNLFLPASPGGTNYQISFRMSANVKYGSLLKFSITTVETGIKQDYLRIGDTVTLYAGLHYNLNVHTDWGP